MEVIKSAGKWLRKVDSEERAMLSAMIVSIQPGVQDKDLETFDSILTRNGYNPKDFVWAKNEKAVHPTCDPELFKRKCAMFAEVAE